MKLCSTCQLCYSDEDVSCVYKDHAPLLSSGAGPHSIAGKYLLRRRVSSGELDAVYAGTHLTRGGRVAVKRIGAGVFRSPQALERFRREVGTAAALQHPNIAKIYEYGLLPTGEAYLVTEWIPGQTLYQYLCARGPLPLVEGLTIARQVADGLEAAHRHGVAHGGLKRTNIFLLTDPSHNRWCVKIVGLGLAVLKELTGGGPLSRTPADWITRAQDYRAPEQFAGRAPDGRSDVYSLGLLLYKMLAGRASLDAPLTSHAAPAPLTARPQRITDWRADVPEALERILMLCLEADPAARLPITEVARQLRYFELRAQVSLPSSDERRRPLSGQSMRESPAVIEVADIQRILGLSEYPLAARVPSSIKSAKGPIARRRWRPLPIYAGLVMAIIVVSGGAWLAQHRRSPRPNAAPAPAIPAWFPQGGGIRRMTLNPPTAFRADGPIAAEYDSVAASAHPSTPAPTAPHKESPPPISPELRPPGAARAPSAKPLASTSAKDTARVTLPPGAIMPPMLPSEIVVPPPAVAEPRAEPRAEPAVASSPSAAPLEANPLRPSSDSSLASTAPRSFEKRADSWRHSLDLTPTVTPPSRSLREGDEVSANVVDRKPVLRLRVDPQMPAAADNISEEVTVFMSLKISETGRVIDTRIIRKPDKDPGFSRAAEIAVKQWRYEPAIKDGVRVRVWTTCQIHFKPAP